MLNGLFCVTLSRKRFFHYLLYDMNPIPVVNWGFIGCGEVTEKKSGPAFGMIEGSRVMAVMSRNAERVRSYAERHHIPRTYTDPQSLINDPEVNAVYIATPPSSHVTYAIMAMRAGKPVYVEKPLATSYEDCLRVNRISQLTGVPCFVAYYRRQLPYFQTVKRLLSEQRIGRPLNVQLRLAVPPRELDYAAGDQQPWRLQPDIGGDGGYFFDLAPHQIDLLHWLFGDIVDTKGYIANMAHLYHVPDTINASFLFMSGLTGSASWCFVAHPSSREDRIQVFGTEGSVAFSVYDYKPVRLLSSRGEELFTAENPAHVQMPIITQVVRHLRGLDTCPHDNIEATPVNWVMDKILGKLDL